MGRSHQQGHSLSLISVLRHLKVLREQVLSRLFDYSLDTRHVQQDPLQNPKNRIFGLIPLSILEQSYTNLFESVISSCLGWCLNWRSQSKHAQRASNWRRKSCSGGNQPFPQGVNHFIQPCSKGIIGKEAVPGLMRGTPSET